MPELDIIRNSKLEMQDKIFEELTIAKSRINVYILKCSVCGANVERNQRRGITTCYKCKVWGKKLKHFQKSSPDHLHGV